MPSSTLLLLGILAQDPHGQTVAPVRRYWDKASFATFEDQQLALEHSTTCYVGNLSYHTREELIYDLARQAGPIKRVIMGLNRMDRTPCGFAFIEYFSKQDCVAAQHVLTGKLLEGRAVKFELDPGFREGRQYGRGKGGGQVRDDLRSEFDQDRGGFGALSTAQGNYPPPLAAAAASLETAMTLESSIQANRRRPDNYRDNQRGGGGGGGGGRRRDRSRDAPMQRGARYPPPSSSSSSYPPPQQQQQQQHAAAAAPKVDEFGRDLVDDA